MSAFSNLPPHAVLPLGAYRFDELRRAALRADQRLLHADVHGAGDGDAVLRALARQFGFGDPPGFDLEALRVSLIGLQPPEDAARPGFVVIVQHLPDSAGFDADRRAALLDVFRDAADHFFDRDVAFRVFYSVERAS